MIPSTAATMKWTSSFILLTAGIAAALPQAGLPPKAKSVKDAKTLEEVAPVIKAATKIDLNAKIRMGAKRQQIRFGPLDMPAAKVSLRIQVLHCHGTEHHRSRKRRVCQSILMEVQRMAVL